MKIIEAESICKSYGSNLALKDFSFEINQGEIIALLGPNGAGKTTFVKSLLGLLRIDSGEMKIFDSTIDDIEVKKRLAYLPEKFNFYKYFTVERTLRFYAKMYQIEKDSIDARVAEALKGIAIENLAGKKLSELSKGQLQRVGIACTIVGDHDLIILDEPFSGLDPIGIKEVKDLCTSLKMKGKTILINSHILSEMEKIADRVFIIHNGRLKLSGTVSELSKEMSLEDKFFEIIKGDMDD